MANRILAGNRSTGGHGLYVSRTGEDVTSTTNPWLLIQEQQVRLVYIAQEQGHISYNS